MNNEVHYTDPSRQSKLPDIDEEERVNTADYVRNLQPVKDQKRRTRKKWLFVLLIFILVTAAAAGYFFIYEPSSSPAPVNPTSSSDEKVSEATPAEVEVKTYTSDGLNISFEYPSNWILNDTTQGIVTVTSPMMELNDISGEEVEAQAVITFMSTGSEVPVFNEVTSMIATLDSKRITYEEPTRNQREQTYLSFAGLTVSGLDAVFITGNSGYQKNQAIQESDIKKIEPIISVMFNKCSADACSDSNQTKSSIAIQPSEWEQRATLRTAQQILQSLKVK